MENKIYRVLCSYHLEAKNASEAEQSLTESAENEYFFEDEAEAFERYNGIALTAPHALSRGLKWFSGKRIECGTGVDEEGSLEERFFSAVSWEIISEEIAE